jgi:hypothetical protein
MKKSVSFRSLVLKFLPFRDVKMDKVAAQQKVILSLQWVGQIRISLPRIREIDKIEKLKWLVIAKKAYSTKSTEHKNKQHY